MKCPEIKKFNKAKKQYAIKLPVWKKLLGFCPNCGKFFSYPVTTERRNTAYVEESCNWLTACKECQEKDYAYFAELWNDYYSSII